LVMEEA
jgi:hypothetical protein